jgi:hypothetical protein
MATGEDTGIREIKTAIETNTKAIESIVRELKLIPRQLLPELSKL